MQFESRLVDEEYEQFILPYIICKQLLELAANCQSSVCSLLAHFYHMCFISPNKMGFI